METALHGIKKFQWYKRTVSKKEWAKKYDIWEKYPKLYEKENEVSFAYMSVEPTLDLQCDDNDLDQVRLFCQKRNLYPRPNKKGEGVPIPSDDINVNEISF